MLRCQLRDFDKRSWCDRHKMGRELLPLIQTRSYGASCEGGDDRICLTVSSREGRQGSGNGRIDIRRHA